MNGQRSTNTSHNNNKQQRDKGSPCLKPRELSKKPEGVPLIKTENRTVEIDFQKV